MGVGGEDEDGGRRGAMTSGSNRNRAAGVLRASRLLRVHARRECSTHLAGFESSGIWTRSAGA